MCFIHTPAWGELIKKLIMATPKGKKDQARWRLAVPSVYSTQQQWSGLLSEACFTHRNDQPTSSSSAHEPCGPVKFIKEDLSVHSLMKGRAVYWNCPTCNGRLESSVVRCTLCGFVRTNSYADESEGQGIGGRLKNWLVGWSLRCVKHARQQSTSLLLCRGHWGHCQSPSCLIFPLGVAIIILISSPQAGVCMKHMIVLWTQHKIEQLNAQNDICS